MQISTKPKQALWKFRWFLKRNYRILFYKERCIKLHLSDGFPAGYIIVSPYGEKKISMGKNWFWILKNDYYDFD